MGLENLGWNDGSCNGDFDTAEISEGLDDKVEIVRREWIESDPSLGTGAVASFRGSPLTKLHSEDVLLV